MALKDNYITITEAAKQLGITRQTISRWIAKGRLPGEKIGRETLIKKKDLHLYNRMRLIGAAADSIMELYTAIVGDVFREEGRMKPGWHVEFPNDDNEDIIHLSDKEKAEVHRRMNPILVEILKDLDSKKKGNLPKNKQQKTEKRTIMRK